jgi:hypothetical protein
MNYLPDWPQTMVLLISASQVMRITGMSHRSLATDLLLSSNMIGNLSITQSFLKSFSFLSLLNSFTLPLQNKMVSLHPTR